MNPRQFTYALLLTVCLLFGLLGGVSSSAEPDGPASQGRPITPAGSLVQDLTTVRSRSARCRWIWCAVRTSRDRAARERPACREQRLRYSVQRRRESRSAIDCRDRSECEAGGGGPKCLLPVAAECERGRGVCAAPQEDGSHALYVSGGFENKIWIFRFQPESKLRSLPHRLVQTRRSKLRSSTSAVLCVNSPRYNSDRAPVYPSGIAISPEQHAFRGQQSRRQFGNHRRPAWRPQTHSRRLAQGCIR